MAENAFKIGEKTIGSSNLFYNIEEGMANLGDFNKALSMIDAAATTKADSIEFQLVIAEDFYVKNLPGFDFCKKCEFSISQIADLISHAKNKGLEFLVAPLSHKLIEPLAKHGCSGFNINASDLTNPQIIDAVVDSGLPFFISIPLATEKEVDWAINRIQKKRSSEFAILHGQHTMMSGAHGVEIAQTSLGFIYTLKKRYNVPIGFIDHTPYIWMSAAAVAAGADSVCKHLAISRNDKGPDWHICLEPDEMSNAVSWARKMKESINQKDKLLAEGEDLDRSKMRRSIVAARDIDAGSVIVQADIAFKRSGPGIEPFLYEEIIGKKLLNRMSENEQFKFEYLKK